MLGPGVAILPLSYMDLTPGWGSYGDAGDFFSDNLRCGLGTTAKWFRTENLPSLRPDGTWAHVDASAWDADFGLALAYRGTIVAPERAGQRRREEAALRFGFVLVNAFDQAIETGGEPAYVQPLGRAVRIGLAGELAGIDDLGRRLGRIIVSVDYRNHFGRVEEDDGAMSIGVEVIFLDQLSFRLGKDEFYASRSGSSYGFGLDTGDTLGRLGLRFDFASAPRSTGVHHYDASLRWKL